MGISTGSWSISSLLIMITISRTPPLLVNWALWVVCGDIPKWQFWKFIGFWGSYPTQKWILKPCWTQDIWTIQNGYFEGSGWKALAGASSGRTSSCDRVLDWAPAWDPKTRRQDSARAEPSLSTKNVVKPIIKLPKMDPFGGSSLPAIDGDITVGIGYFYLFATFFEIFCLSQTWGWLIHLFQDLWIEAHADPLIWAEAPASMHLDTARNSFEFDASTNGHTWT